MPNIKSFITPEGFLSQDKIDEHLKEFKRLADLKAEKDKSEAKRLGLPPPPALVTFGMTPIEKKRKRKELTKEVFVTKDVRVDGMGSNLIPPHGVIPIQGLVISEPEGIQVKDIVKEVEDHLKTYSSAEMDIS
ncbi:hypothetical protein Tco_0996132 [Tanacetum coccineum]